MKIDKTVLKETKYIIAFTVVLSVLMQAVFLIIGKWDYRVLLGNIWGTIITIGNFFVMGLFVQKAVTQESDNARKTIKTSYSLRFAAIVLLVVIGMLIPVFNKVAVVVPLIFPRIAILLRPLADKKM